VKYISVEEAIHTPGNRLVLTVGVPGPWGEAAKSILAYKGLEFTAVYQEGGGENTALRNWTGQTSAPVFVHGNLPPVSHWLDLLLLAERLAPDKPLLPDNYDDRALVLGLSALVAGVDGFGWNRRLQMLAPMMALPEPPEVILRLAEKYGWSKRACADATGKLEKISAALDRRLTGPGDRVCEYLVGGEESAADFYWASFSGMVKPLGPEDNPMPGYMRQTYEAVDERTRACLTPALEAHRDRMYQRHISLPLDFLVED